MTSALIGIALAGALAAPQVVPLTGSPIATRDSIGALQSQVRAVPNRDADVNSMLASLNARRTAQGLAPLQLEPQLCAIAYEHASDMVARSYFDHFTPEGVSPFGRMDRARYHYGYAGENLALDQSATAAELALWGSPEHRRNILEPHYARVGIAAVESRDGEIIVEDFSD